MFRLDEPSCIPAEIRSILSKNRAAMERSQYFDHLLETRELRSAAEQLDEVVTRGNVVGYHCTKELHPCTFSTNGLRPLSIGTHVGEFLQLAATLAPALVDEFAARYSRWRTEKHIVGREGRLWFCLTRDLVVEHGTEDFFTYYDGEALYRAFPEGHKCRSFLATLGRPVVVEVTAPARDLTVFSRLPYARALVGSYAKTVNPAFQIERLEGYLSRATTPAEILRVHEREAFFASGRRLTLV